MPAFFAAIVAFFTSGIAKLLIERLLFFLALKALIIAVCTILLPIILNNLLGDLLQTAIDYMNNISISSVGNQSFSGFLGWLIDCFKIPQVLSITVSAFQMHITLKMIPFSPIK